MADPIEMTTLELFQHELREAFNQLKENATDEEWAEAKDATMRLCYRFIEDVDDGPPPAKKARTNSRSPFIDAMNNEDVVLVEHSNAGEKITWHDAIIQSKGYKASTYDVEYIHADPDGGDCHETKGSEPFVPVARIALKGSGPWGDERRAKYVRKF
jgi:hypothetical protein